VVPKDVSKDKEKWEKRKAELIGEVEVKFDIMLKQAQEMQLDEDLKELDSPRDEKRDEEE